MQFNKLYNIILQNIITQNKASRRAMLQKAYAEHGLKDNIINTWEKFFDTMDNKTADFICKYVANGDIKSPDDKRIDQIVFILHNQSSIDIQQNISLKDFLNKYKKVTQKQDNKKYASNLDSIKQLSQKKDYGDGVVVYKVQDNKKGLLAIRKIIDAQYGRDRNPWCLISRENGKLDKAWKYWKGYNAYPKHVAFKDGKIFAFCANDYAQTVWWDMDDHDNDVLTYYTEEGYWEELRTQEYKLYTLEQKAKLFFILNKETNRYDVDGILSVKDNDLVDGHFPIPIGVVNGDLEIYENTKLIDFTNGPTEVKGDIYGNGCTGLKSLKGFPKKISGTNIDFGDCKNLTSLKEIRESDFKGTVYNDGCDKLPASQKLLFSLKQNKLLYIQEKGVWNYIDNITITDQYLVDGHLPVKFGIVGGDFYMNNCETLTSLENCPEMVRGSFSCGECTKLKSLEGGPKQVGKTFNCGACNSLHNLKGAPEKVGGYFDCSECYSLQSLQGAPKYVGSNFNCHWCMHLASVKDLPKTIKYDLIATNCPKIPEQQWMEVIPKIKVGEQIHISRKYSNMKKQLPPEYKKKVHLW